jgi:hypothetical protein
LFLPAAAVLTLTVALPARSLAQAQDDATKFRNRETAVWESVKNKELESIRKVFDNDYVAVYEDGIVDRSAEVAGMAKMTLRRTSSATSGSTVSTRSTWSWRTRRRSRAT